ncbi:Dynein heavy chain 3, axonemal [Allomyces javanicus]|nr:Dynein heavy chain 3, axonemal [Allomyces javanicus]
MSYLKLIRMYMSLLLQSVKLVMEVVCIMKDVKLVKIPDLATGKKVEDYWGPPKTMLLDLKFLKHSRPTTFKSELSATESPCKWVRAMEMYDHDTKVMAPKKEALSRVESELNKTMKCLEEKRTTLKAIEDKMAALENNFKAMTVWGDTLECG